MGRKKIIKHTNKERGQKLIKKVRTTKDTRGKSGDQHGTNK